VGITTETRNASPNEAKRRVREAMARPGQLLYKKIDSTLRGPIVAELAALLEERPRARVLFAPANPRAGRIVRDGLLWVHGRPVAETEFAHDPLCPVRESSVRRLLSALPADRMVIPDTETAEDLRAAVARMDAEGGEWVGVGSGALANSVAEVRLGRREASHPAGSMPSGKTLLVCGSAHPGNRQQAEMLRQEHGIPLFALDGADVETAVQAVTAHLRDGAGATLVAPSARTTSAEALDRVTEAALRIIAECDVRRLFISGGETGYAVCRALGISALQFMKEIEPGVALSAAKLQERPMRVAMKPGGFGDAATWVRVWDALTAS
jgi:uncharacterized protein YgbK (DUF1537 family)